MGIIRIFSQLYFEPAFAYSLCASFVTCICLFIERDVSYLKEHIPATGLVLMLSVDWFIGMTLNVKPDTKAGRTPRRFCFDRGMPRDQAW